MTEDHGAPAERPDDPLTDHSYDGIQEYDNPMPRWWLYIFYATILYSLLYVLNVPGIGIGAGRMANYERDMEAARVQRAAVEAKAPKPEVSETLLRSIASDPARLADGRATFTTTCATCHAADGGGNIGPNLTDKYWLRGGHPMEVHATVTHGALDKGMPAWGEVYTPDQIVNVVGYVLTLRGTHPAQPKPPQGVEMEEDGETEHGESHELAEKGHGNRP